jgi:DNA repair protein RadD
MLWARGLEGNDLVSLPTGSGKSLIISELAKKLREPILILVPSKELLQQDKEKLSHWTDVNVYSAGMNEKTVGEITLATIQSAYKNPERNGPYCQTPDPL